MGYITQFRDMDDENTVFDEIAQGNDWIDIGDNTMHVRHYLSGVRSQLCPFADSVSTLVNSLISREPCKIEK